MLMLSYRQCAYLLIYFNIHSTLILFKVRIRFLTCYVTLILAYDSERWAESSTMRKRIEPSER